MAPRFRMHTYDEKSSYQVRMIMVPIHSQRSLPYLKVQGDLSTHFLPGEKREKLRKFSSKNFSFDCATLMDQERLLIQKAYFSRAWCIHGEHHGGLRIYCYVVHTQPRRSTRDCTLRVYSQANSVHTVSTWEIQMYILLRRGS